MLMNFKILTAIYVILYLPIFLLLSKLLWDRDYYVWLLGISTMCHCYFIRWISCLFLLHTWHLYFCMFYLFVCLFIYFILLSYVLLLLLFILLFLNHVISNLYLFSSILHEEISCMFWKGESRSKLFKRK